TSVQPAETSNQQKKFSSETHSIIKSFSDEETQEKDKKEKLDKLWVMGEKDGFDEMSLPGTERELYDTMVLTENHLVQKSTIGAITLIKGVLDRLKSAYIKVHCLYDICADRNIRMILQRKARTILIMHNGCHWVTVANIKQFRRFSIMDTNYRGVSTVLFQLLNHYVNCKAYQYTHYEIEIESVPQHEIKNDSDMYWSLGYAILSYVKFNAHETEISSSEFDLADIIKFIENLDEHPSIEKFPVRPTTTSEKDRCPSLLHLIQLRCVCRSPTIADTSEFYICKKDRCYMRVHTSCMEDHDRLNHLQISRLQKYTNLDEDLNDLTSDKNIESTEPIEELQQPRRSKNKTKSSITILREKKNEEPPEKRIITSTTKSQFTKTWAQNYEYDEASGEGEVTFFDVTELIYDAFLLFR
ncbi:unnamed protein product, partial [Didymodactylos carnosus]